MAAYFCRAVQGGVVGKGLKTRWSVARAFSPALSKTKLLN